jgi:hypothetical protein
MGFTGPTVHKPMWRWIKQTDTRVHGLLTAQVWYGEIQSCERDKNNEQVEECYVRDRDRPLALAITGGLMLVIIVVLTVVPALLAARVALGLLGMMVYRGAR